MYLVIVQESTAVSISECPEGDTFDNIIFTLLLLLIYAYVHVCIYPHTCTQ